MDFEVEPLQQPIRKAVGRPAGPSEQLARVEDMLAFVQKYAARALTRAEGDYFPVRKAVGRSRPKQS